MGVIELPTSGFVCLDTSPIIYSVEKIEPFARLMKPVWQAAHNGQIQLLGSELLLLETTVKPRELGNTPLINLFKQLLTAREFQLQPISRSILEAAAKLRAEQRLRTPDAIHIATAIAANAQMFITNDKRLSHFKTLNVIVLGDFL